MPQSITGMYNEQLTDTNLRALMDVQDINSITSTANGLLGKQDADGNGLDEATLRERRIELFYDKVFLDTIKLGSENNVYLKYCITKEVPAGHAKLFLRRWSGLTEHTVPLSEGVPPKSDFSRTESFEATFAQYGRYMEFSDRVEFNLIDPIIAMKTAEYGDLAVRTAERLCREEMIHMGSKVYANGGANISTMVIGDTVGIEDYRLLALKLKRILVNPINGYYIVICSPEHIYDLVQDPLVISYMNYTHTAEPLKTGKPVELFNIRFEETMLDDFGYNYAGDMADALYHPGEYMVGTDYYMRAYTIVDGVEYYVNVKNAEYDTGKTYRTVADAVIKDGSYIPNKVSWDISAFLAAIDATSGITNKDGEAVDVTVVTGTDRTLADDLAESTWYELPVHKSFMFGKEHMVKTGISGRSGAKIYVKPKGSAGVLDPIDQRQSIGFKIDTLGFTNIRPESLHVFYFVPTKAAATQEYAINHAPKWTENFKTA